jgi:uncharacterized membrane protein
MRVHRGAARLNRCPIPPVFYPLVLVYPLVCHFAATLGYPWAAVAWLGLLLIASAVTAKEGRALPLAFGLACLGIAGFAGDGVGVAALAIPPVAIPLGLAFLFGHTLLPGRTPLVARIAAHFRGPLPAPVAAYCRGLTRLWTWLLVALALESLLLALFADPFWWSLGTNLINYMMIGGVFAAEYAVRRRILANEAHPPFFGYVRGMLRLGLRVQR